MWLAARKIYGIDVSKRACESAPGADLDEHGPAVGGEGAPGSTDRPRGPLLRRVPLEMNGQFAHAQPSIAGTVKHRHTVHAFENPDDYPSAHSKRNKRMRSLII